MTPDVAVFSVEKAGNTPSENEDRAAWSFESGAVRAAIADGATESSFSDTWAEALVTAWIAQNSAEIGAEFLTAARRMWTERLPAPESLPWYALAKLEEGSHATFAGIRVSTHAKRMRWRIHVVGDCEVFILKRRRSLRLVRREPLATAAEFGYHPLLIRSTNEAPLNLQVVIATGRLRPPFEVWLCTDAFAAACLQAQEDGHPPWDEWSAGMTESAPFKTKVDQWRASGLMRNDDTTVCRIRVL